MNNIDKGKFIKMVVILALIVAVASMLMRLSRGNSYTLGDYAAENPTAAYAEHTEETEETQETDAEDVPSATEETGETQDAQSDSLALLDADLVGVSLNTASMKERVTYTDGFYTEPLSTHLRNYITGISYPTEEALAGETPAITPDELSYVHILYYNFDSEVCAGELICNAQIAQDLVEIFYELYRNEYQLERVALIDEYDGDDIASMEDNNTSCFNYRVVEGTSSLSKHALGLAIDINPLYNPYITYRDGTMHVSPEAGEAYADRDASFPYKVDEEDLCYKLFTQHGFTWGGNWNSVKDYQHFQKVAE